MTYISFGVPDRMMSIEIAAYYDYIVVVYVNIVSEIFVEFVNKAFIVRIIDVHD